jgi:hypothetical protein
MGISVSVVQHGESSLQQQLRSLIRLDRVDRLPAPEEVQSIIGADGASLAAGLMLAVRLLITSPCNS